MLLSMKLFAVNLKIEGVLGLYGEDGGRGVASLRSCWKLTLCSVDPISPGGKLVARERSENT